MPCRALRDHLGSIVVVGVHARPRRNLLPRGGCLVARNRLHRVSGRQVLGGFGWIERVVVPRVSVRHVPLVVGRYFVHQLPGGHGGHGDRGHVAIKCLRGLRGRHVLEYFGSDCLSALRHGSLQRRCWCVFVLAVSGRHVCRQHWQQLV
jgi:hypothetical protein